MARRAPDAAPIPEARPAVRGSSLVRVRYAECDPMGVAHHASYVPWLEVARTDLLRATGVSYADLERAGVYLVVVRLECSFRRPAFYDDLLEVRAVVSGGSRVKIRHEYEVVRAVDAAARAGGAGGGVVPGDSARVRGPVGELLMVASSLLACVDRAGRPSPLPGWLVPVRDAEA